MQTTLLNPQQAEIVRDYNVGYKFVIEMPKQPADMTTEQEAKYVPKSGKYRCDITDKGTGCVYIQCYGFDQVSALDAALKKVLVTPKPLTKDRQRIEDNLAHGTKDEIIADKDAEIARLKAALAGGQSAPSATPPKRKGGRPRKNPLPEHAQVAPA